MTKLRLIAIACAVLALMAAGFAAGVAVATWQADAELARAQADHLAEVRRLEQLQVELEAKVAEQNKAVEIMAAQAHGAELARQQAEQRATEQAQLSASRMAKLERAAKDSTTAGEVLLRYWELVE